MTDDPPADGPSTGPGDVDLRLGCGNPTATAPLDAGNAVLDLGAGAGFDCFLAAEEVGPDGRVVGVDMTPEMVERARENAETNGVANVEFRLGEIDHLPVADESVDVVVSNCVVNLSPARPQVFCEWAEDHDPGDCIVAAAIDGTKPVPEDVE